MPSVAKILVALMLAIMVQGADAMPINGGWSAIKAGSKAAEKSQYALREMQVTVASEVPLLTHRAADELRRYLYLLTGQWDPIATTSGPRRIIRRIGVDAHVSTDGLDPSQNFALYVENNNQVVHGASPVATLWAAYELIESGSAGSYLGGDQLPKLNPGRRTAFIQRAFKPSLAIRGSLPWLNFANSPTSCYSQDYRTFLERMAKQKADFIGFHSYDHEPLAEYFPNKVAAPSKRTSSRGSELRGDHCPPRGRQTAFRDHPNANVDQRHQFMIGIQHDFQRRRKHGLLIGRDFIQHWPCLFRLVFRGPPEIPGQLGASRDRYASTRPILLDGFTRSTQAISTDVLNPMCPDAGPGIANST